jgi:hypothetical protein
MSRCLHCNNLTKNPKFCSKSCSAKVSNKIPKRKKTKLCKHCNKNIKADRTYCKQCFIEFNSAKDMTLKEAIYTKGHKSSAFALVRARARSTEKIKNATSCVKCGYNKHVEACHIQAISTFTEDTLLSIINHDQNLIALCPNCHWEFDHGLFTLN